MKHLIVIIIAVLFFTDISFSQTFTDIKAELTNVAESSSGWIDADRDGDIDAMVSGEFFTGTARNIQQRLYKNLRNDKFAQAASGLPDFYRGDFSIGDYNLDGVDDIAIMGEKRDASLIGTIYRGMANGTFTPTSIQFVAMRDGSIDFGDYDADGDLDILIAGEGKNGAQTLVYRNDRNNVFSLSGINLIGIHRGEARWIDFDVDGKPDIFLIGAVANGKPYCMLYHNRDSIFSPVKTSVLPLKNSSVALGDVDSDGDNDLLIMGETNSARAATRLYRNERNGIFRITSTNFIGVRSGFADWSDMDHDGDKDLLISGESDHGAVSKVYRNDKGAGFTDLQAAIVPLYTSDGEWGDYDSDGDQDVLISGLSTDYKYYSKIYRNNRLVVSDTSYKAEEESEDIWNNQTVVEDRTEPIYYYVYSSSFSDLLGTGKKAYYMFVSQVKKPKVQYEMEEKFDKLIIQAYPTWPKVDQGNITSVGFKTKTEADESRTKMIFEYKRRGFEVIEINW
ncbi:MAG: VCBS repeat-containing protein [Bacteroidales bacterium]|nr:VCBS repeat-containing protein [Bacteroidales bacterium]